MEEHDMFRKAVCFSLALLLVPLCFLAAGGNKDGSGSTGSGIALTTARTMDPTVQFDQSNPERRSFDENRWNTTFQRELGVKLTHKWISTDEDSNNAKWSTAIASGDIPDFAVVSDNIYKMLVDADLVADMTTVFPQNASAELKSMTEDFKAGMTFNGKLLGIPFPGYPYFEGVLFIRQDWLDTLGLAVPKTMEDVIAVARAFKNAKLGGNDTIGLLFTSNGSVTNGRWEGFLNGYGAYIDTWIEKNGQLVYGSVQNEMKDALLSMQALYRDGTINRDFAVANDTVAQEYVASGKVGIFYGTSWITTTSIVTLHNNDPKAKIINIFPPSVQGKKYPMQVGAATATKLFVSKKCKNPEAIVKMINLCYQYENDAKTYRDYSVDNDGFLWYKFMPWNHVLSSLNDFEMADAIRQAEQKGTKIEKVTWQNAYEGYLREKNGTEKGFNMTTFGPGGSYTTIFDAYNSKMLLLNAFSGLPTETMALTGSILADNLKTAMLEVVAGADISVYDKAINDWLNNGGRKITEEVNTWYKGTK
jgi:putative aldouronate transport system substrate-binding protein